MIFDILYSFYLFLTNGNKKFSSIDLFKIKLTIISLKNSDPTEL